jgi:hypothetical protein
MGRVVRDHEWRWVTIARLAAMSGYSEKAIRQKVARGVWQEEREYRRAPDGRLLCDLDAVTKWIEGDIDARDNNKKRNKCRD